MTRTIFRPVSLSLALLISPVAAYAQDIVSTCGETVLNGVLAGDLDCSGALHGVILEPDGTFDLAGHTLTAGTRSGVFCLDDCTIEGSGGAVSGGAVNGIEGVGRDSAVVTVSNLAISNNGLDGVWSNGAVVTNCQIADNMRAGIIAWHRDAEVSGSSVSGSANGIYARKKISVANSTVSQNKWGVSCEKRATVVDSSIDDNDDFGIFSIRVKATDSTFQNNGLACSGDSAGCYDIGSVGRPRLDPVACATSQRLERGSYVPLGEDWDLCAND
jgi:hypothetical protein